MSGRSEARRFILQMLFLLDQNPDADAQRIDRQAALEFKDPLLRSFIRRILDGIRQQRGKLDQQIRQTAHNWRLERMAVTDRNVIRLGLYEMLHEGTPAAVAINEAVEIAREFGSENSAAFVNGILDRLNPKSRSAKTPADTVPAAPDEEPKA